jgi:hypothetical protein
MMKTQKCGTLKAQRICKRKTELLNVCTGIQVSECLLLERVSLCLAVYIHFLIGDREHGV